MGNIFEESLISILDRKREFIGQLRNFGTMPREACAKCNGAPTKHGAFVKGAVKVAAATLQQIGAT